MTANTLRLACSSSQSPFWRSYTSSDSIDQKNPGHVRVTRTLLHSTNWKWNIPSNQSCLSTPAAEKKGQRSSATIGRLTILVRDVAGHVGQLQRGERLDKVGIVAELLGAGRARARMSGRSAGQNRSSGYLMLPTGMIKARTWFSASRGCCSSMRENAERAPQEAEKGLIDARGSFGEPRRRMALMAVLDG